jgi:hypothetical protein
MGCNSSKRIEASEDVYLPPPSSFAVFDINSIQEPWLVVDNIFCSRKSRNAIKCASSNTREAQPV